MLAYKRNDKRKSIMINHIYFFRPLNKNEIPNTNKDDPNGFMNSRNFCILFSNPKSNCVN